MIKKMSALLLAGIVAAAGADEGWTSLFNGQDFTGWTFDVFDGSDPGSIWSVEDGILKVAGKGQPNGVIRTTQSYSDYELQFEWRWPDDGGNSGCLIHSSTPREMNVWPKSIEVQLMKNNAGDFWLIGEELAVTPDQVVKGKNGKTTRRRANLIDDAEKALGEWNVMQIIAQGDRIEVRVNGQLVNQGWDASTTAGAICLQAERANVEFRNIRLRSVSSDKD